MRSGTAEGGQSEPELHLAWAGPALGGSCCCCCSTLEVSAGLNNALRTSRILTGSRIINTPYTRRSVAVGKSLLES